LNAACGADRLDRASDGYRPPVAKPLDRYRRKRDFERSSEPRPDRARARSRKPIFVIQKHAARSLHYDFRLEVDGVLRSWAVPKGPSTDPRQKRLAVEVEDHPLAYADFEGVIEEGNYGAGQVIVWDRGTYRNLSHEGDDEVPLSDALERGRASVWLEGQKLQGGYALTRTRGGPKPQWLLVKRRDEKADARRNPVSTQPESVLSGRTVEDLRDGR
jgi:DNA ligase D-like protein (predicted 3'-phosphoesterase)